MPTIGMMIIAGAAGCSVEPPSTVEPLDRPPRVREARFETLEDTPLSALITAKDPDGEAVALTLELDPRHGKLWLSEDGTFLYVPDPDYDGPDSFRVVGTDPGGLEMPATIAIDVRPLNDPPTISSFSYQMLEDGRLTARIVSFDADGDTLSFEIEREPARGTVTVDPVARRFTYDPDPNYWGPDSFDIAASDGAAWSDLARIAIDVAPVNDPPLAGPLDVKTDEDTPVTAALPVFDPDGDVEVWVDSAPRHGTATIDLQAWTFTYTPAADRHGSDVFTIVAQDALVEIPPERITVDVQSVNDAPVVQPLSLVVEGGQVVTEPIDAWDVDGDPLAFAVTADPQHGAAQVDPSGVLSYTPDDGYVGADGLVVTVSDGALATTTAVRIRVTGT